jgi:hypothetical protein
MPIATYLNGCKAVPKHRYGCSVSYICVCCVDGRIQWDMWYSPILPHVTRVISPAAVHQPAKAHETIQLQMERGMAKLLAIMTLPPSWFAATEVLSPLPGA